MCTNASPIPNARSHFSLSFHHGVGCFQPPFPLIQSSSHLKTVRFCPSCRAATYYSFPTPPIPERYDRLPCLSTSSSRFLPSALACGPTSPSTATLRALYTKASEHILFFAITLSLVVLKSLSLTSVQRASARVVTLPSTTSHQHYRCFRLRRPVPTPLSNTPAV